MSTRQASRADWTIRTAKEAPCQGRLEVKLWGSGLGMFGIIDTSQILLATATIKGGTTANRSSHNWLDHLDCTQRAR
jgi:hypothetical protein